MAADNASNLAWNLLHGGARVPINDTDLEGAPASLSSADPAWEDGSINKAVKSTWDLNGGLIPAEKLADYNAGILDLKSCGSFIFTDALYGYKGDSLNKQPGDMMSYRGYPTGELVSETYEVDDPAENLRRELDGSAGLITGEYITHRYTASIEHALPYDLIWTITPGGDDILQYPIEVKILAGYTTIGEGRRVVNDPTIWLTLDDGFVRIPTDSSGFTGDKIFTILGSAFQQPPVYGTFNTGLTFTVTELEYDAVVANPYYAWKGMWINPAIIINCTINSCNEYPASAIKGNFVGTYAYIYNANGQTVEVGATLYLNVAGDLLPAGTYCIASSRYYNVQQGEYIYGVTTLLMVGANGLVTLYDPAVNGPFRCWETGPCIAP